MSSSIRRALAMGAAATAIQFASFAALAQEPASAVMSSDEPTVTAARETERRTATVDYSDLNLSSKAGMATLYTRIRGATRDVCGDNADIRHVRNYRAQQACKEQAWNDAMAQVDDVVSEIRVAAR